MSRPADWSGKNGRHATFVVLWKAQSWLAQFACIGLVACYGAGLALGVMLGWAFMATVVYWQARERGFPDLLEFESLSRHKASTRKLRSVAASTAKVWSGGLPSFFFSRASAGAMTPCTGWRRLRRGALLLIGLTLFGVTLTEHLLRKAGYAGPRLLQLSVLGVLINVPYHVLVNSALTQLVWAGLHFVHSQTPL